MRIALDYDDTFTEDPTFWAEMVTLAKRRGHSVTFVTFRKEKHESYTNHDIEEDAQWLGIDIVYCNLKQKATQFEADVWIDDSPHFIPSADHLKNHCEQYDVAYELTHPLADIYKIDKNVEYTGKMKNGVLELFNPDGTPCKKRYRDRWGNLKD